MEENRGQVRHAHQVMQLPVVFSMRLLGSGRGAAALDRMLAGGRARRGLEIAAVALLLLVAGVNAAVFSRAANSASAPNIILISLETVRADHLEAWGYERPTAPALTALARRVVLYANAVAQAPWPFVTRTHGFDQGFTRFDQEVIAEDGSEVLAPEITRRALNMIDSAYVDHEGVDHASGYRGFLPRVVDLEAVYEKRERLQEADVQYIRDLYDEEITGRSSSSEASSATSEIFDLAADPGERRNLAFPSERSTGDAAPGEAVPQGSVPGEVAAHLARAIDALPSVGSQPGDEAILSEEEIERLRALGYIR